MAKRSGPLEIIQAISVTFLTCLLLSAVLEPLQSLAASEQLTVKQNGKSTRLTGEILVEAQDGGLLFVARDGALWIVQPEQLQQRKRLAQETLPLSQTEMFFLKFENFHQIFEKRAVAVCVFKNPYF